MIILGIIAIYLLGFSIINLFGRDSSILEKIGLSFLIGCGVETVFMFFLDVIHIRFTAWTLLLLSFGVIIILNLNLIRHYKELKNPFNPLKNKLREFKFNRFCTINWPWISLLVLVAYLLVASVAKSLYWPVTAYDSVAGYDLMGKAIANEGRIFVSLFQWNLQGPRGIYPPLAEGTFAYAYMFGMTSSKLMLSINYISFVLVFYALLRKYTNRISAALFSLIMIVTPEMYAFSSLSNTNVMGAAYAGLAIIYLFLWTDKKNKFDFYIASILMGMNVWLRNDGIIFNISGFLILLWNAFREKNWKPIFIYSVIAFSPFIIWTIYLKYVIGISQDRFVNYLYWDGDRFKKLMQWIKILIMNTSYYGWSFYIFFVSLVLNIKHFYRDKIILLELIFISFLGFAAVYYQLDDLKQDPLDSMMRNSFRRGLFYFIPMILFYASTNKTVVRVFNWIEKFRSGNIKIKEN
ncbi:MAG: glycosyltransferase family 39 protein [Candidatus Marinimicrobia bacterium]|nr:glycosyltransferase family 39 protein [Candidatus Neomarinimicrobiota bacterium]